MLHRTAEETLQIPTEKSADYRECPSSDPQSPSSLASLWKNFGDRTGQTLRRPPHAKNFFLFYLFIF